MPKWREKMVTCNICGIPSRACPVYDDKINICGECSFKVIVVRDGLVTCIELMEDLFTSCPNPRDLYRVFSFIGNHITMLFDGIASEKTGHTLWNIITDTYAETSDRFLSDDFFNHREYPEMVMQNIKNDQYLLDMLSNESFDFAQQDRDDPSHQIPLGTITTEGSGMWNLGEQLILESLNDVPDSDEEEQLY